MPIEAIIEAANDKNPLGLKAAFTEELGPRIAAALAEKRTAMSEAEDEDDSDEDEDQDDEDDEDDSDEDEDDEDN